MPAALRVKCAGIDFWSCHNSYAICTNQGIKQAGKLHAFRPVIIPVYSSVFSSPYPSRGSTFMGWFSITRSASLSR